MVKNSLLFFDPSLEKNRLILRFAKIESEFDNGLFESSCFPVPAGETKLLESPKP